MHGSEPTGIAHSLFQQCLMTVVTNIATALFLLLLIIMGNGIEDSGLRSASAWHVILRMVSQPMLLCDAHY